jgi:hypothetical protein
MIAAFLFAVLSLGGAVTQAVDYTEDALRAGTCECLTIEWAEDAIRTVEDHVWFDMALAN